MPKELSKEQKSSLVFYMALELIFGVLLCLLFISLMTNSKNDAFWGKSMAEGIIKGYAAISLIFFFSVISIGIIGARKLNLSHKISKSILYSLGFWVLSLFASLFLSVIGPISIYIILIGIAAGFNLGMLQKSDEESKNKEKNDENQT